MAAIVDYVEDIEFNVSSGGSEIIMEKGISATSFSEIVTGNLIPAYGTRHPTYTAFRLISGSISRTGNDGGKWQGFWRGTYSTQSSSGGSTTQVDKDPWDLDAQNYTVDPFPIEIPMVGGYNESGIYKRLLNTAGCVLQRTQTIYGASHKFIYCVRRNPPDFGNYAIVNNATCKIAGTTFEKHSSMLMPPSAAYRVEYTDSGTVKRSYWEISVEIRVHPKTWVTETLNVGTMARFKDKNGTLKKIPETIYKYYPWKSSKEADNFKTEPAFGSIHDVAKAKHDYAILVSGGAKNDKYYQAYKELPWEEVTEPLPLNSDGEVYVDALKDPTKNEYKTIKLFDTDLGSFSQFGFPKKREG